MSLRPGDRLGPYEIADPIGKGGMGEVYRARDTRIGRDVAIKISSEKFSERFEREARAIASLNHPNICTLFDVGPNYLVMELVEGEAPKGPLPYDDALAIMRQVAEALEAAHEKGIIHRDLKPGNIKVTPQGVVKVLDFGLAKVGPRVASSDPEDSPTISMAATQAGVILGTAAYMSPEQARGKSVDKRADIWAFGVVFYELLTGKRPFRGDDLTEILASVVKETPDLSAAPPQARRLLEKCLEKDPKHRLRDITGAALLLQPPPKERASASVYMWLAAAGALTAGALAFALWQARRPQPTAPPPVIRFSIPAPVAITSGGLAISRDGNLIAYTSGSPRQIWVRPIDRFEARSLPGTDGAQFLAFSPDGASIAFFAAGQLKKVSSAGGSVETLAPAAASQGPPTVFWAEDRHIYYADSAVLRKIPDAGGAPVEIANPKNSQFACCAQPLPGGRSLLYSTAGPVYVLDLASGRRTTLTAGVNARFIPDRPGSATGYLTWARATDAALVAAPFDAETTTLGQPIPIGDGIRGADPFGVFGFSDTGVFVYVPSATGSRTRTLAWLDRKGRETPLDAPPRDYRAARISPTDPHRLALQIGQQREAGIWVYDTMRGTFDPIARETAITPVWTADGKRILYTFTNPEESLMWAAADRSGPPAVLVRQRGVRPSSTSLDGRTLVGFGNLGAFWAVNLSPEPTREVQPSTFLDTTLTKRNPTLSPDGRWIAYTTNESGSSQLYVTSFPQPGAVYTITSEGANEGVRWTTRGEILYRSENKFMAVDVQTSPSFRAGRPHELFTAAGYAFGDASADGQRFLAIKVPSQQAAPDRINVVLNWLEEFRRRTAAPENE